MISSSKLSPPAGSRDGPRHLELVCTVGLSVPAAFHWQPALTVVAATVLVIESLVFDLKNGPSCENSARGWWRPICVLEDFCTGANKATERMWNQPGGYHPTEKSSYKTHLLLAMS
jgi:hypothetical protein